METAALIHRQTINLPEIGDYKDVPVVEILVKPGDVVKLDDPIIVLESDKATIEVPSPLAGTVVELLVGMGQKVSAGAPIAVFETETMPRDGTGETREEAVPDAKSQPGISPEAVAPVLAPSAPAPTLQATSRGHASPSVRAYARELGVALDEVQPSGRKGRVLREDVQSFVKSRIAPPTPAGLSIPPPSSYDFARYGEVEHIPLTRVQQISGTSLHRNWVTIPHVTNFDEADVTELEAFRKALNAETGDADAKLTMVAFLVKASALALKAHPRFNASLAGDTLVLKNYVHIGVAVDTPKGLLVPVIRDCDRKGVGEIGREIASLAGKARNGRLAPAEMEGGCFSVSSLGGIGGTGFTPIINAPEVAILGAARAQIQARWDGTGFQPRLIMPVSLSWDHRVVDGVAAAHFLGTITRVLGDFRRAAL